MRRRYQPPPHQRSGRSRHACAVPWPLAWAAALGPAAPPRPSGGRRPARDPVLARPARRPRRDRRRVSMPARPATRSCRPSTAPTRRRWPRPSPPGAPATAPHVVQIFEVGTGTMMAAGRAVKPAYELLAEAGVEVPLAATCRRSRGYYRGHPGAADLDAVQLLHRRDVLNKDDFRRPGSTPRSRPKPGSRSGRRGEDAEGGQAAPVAVTSCWPAWIHVEQMSGHP